jgi:hypothetical protein
MLEVDPKAKALADGSWNTQSLAVLERACDHYGGLETWQALSKVRLIADRLSGLVPWLKGNGRTFRPASVFEIQPHERRARFLNYPDAEHVGIYDDGALRLERSDTKEVVAQAREHRQSFRGPAKNRRWTPLDALYFFGYALTHYHSLPFSLYDARLIRAHETGPGSDRLSVLDVELPADLATHCRRQSFYFDRAGRLVRHDYTADIVGFWARGAHFWKRQTSFAGFPVALDRHVFARLGGYACPVTALRGTFSEAEVELGRVATEPSNSTR